MIAPLEQTSCEPTDEELVRRCARGEVDALEQLYDRYASLLLSVARRVLKTRFEAEDVLHNVFLEVWHHAADYDESRGRVRSWLVMRARCRALDSLRKWGLRHELTEPEETLAPEPDHVTRLMILNAIDTLPVEMRSVVELSFSRGLTSGEIAKELDIPVGTVKSRLARAVARLRQAMES